MKQTMRSPVEWKLMGELLRAAQPKLLYMRHSNAQRTRDWFMYGSLLPPAKGKTITWRRNAIPFKNTNDS